MIILLIVVLLVIIAFAAMGGSRNARLARLPEAEKARLFEEGQRVKANAWRGLLFVVLPCVAFIVIIVTLAMMSSH